ncbi:MAG: nuclear transport factor 2 family protein [Colwellia sp.]|nr:nuclear transport factor 2 family protein [Colwellia sp.]
MFNNLIELYTRGDIAQLSSNILHSSSWKQHDFTAYGNMQIEKLWLKSLEQFGFFTLSKKQTVQGKEFSALYFELKNDEANQSVSITFFLEHNNIYIKRLHCIVDTVRLAQLLNLTPEQVIAELPSPDPLFLSQFDHQMHPQSYHARPSDICDMPKDIDQVITQWWSIWQEKHLASFEKIYHTDAQVNIAGFGSNQGYQALRQFQLKLHNRMNRNYCQLEQLCVDEQQNTIAIQWHIDGDYLENDTIKRIRLPITSIIRLENNLIVDEQLQVDWLALCKGFNLSYPFV